MNDIRLRGDTHTVSLDCTLPGNADCVWRHLTEAQGLRAWLADAQLEPRLGGSVRFQFRGHDPLVRSNCGSLIRGVISHFEPKRRLAYSWLDAGRDISPFSGSGAVPASSRVTFNLTRGDGKTLLSLTHIGLSAQALANVGAGWNTHLGLLANVLSEDADGGIGAQHAAFVQRGSYVESSFPGMRV